MKYLKQYESFTSSLSEKELEDIFSINLEDNPHFDVIDINITRRPMYGALQDIEQYVVYIEIDVNEIDDTLIKHSRDIVSKIGKKYNFRVLHTGVELSAQRTGKYRIKSFVYPYTKQQVQTQNESVDSDTTLRDKVFYDIEDNIDFDILELKEVSQHTNYSDYAQRNNPDYGTYHIFESTIQVNPTSKFYTPLDKASTNFGDDENSKITQDIVNSFETALRKSARKNDFVIYRGFYSQPDGKTTTFILQNEIKPGIRLSAPHIGNDSYDFKIKFVLKD
jgi:hypothetical protein